MTGLCSPQTGIRLGPLNSEKNAG